MAGLVKESRVFEKEKLMYETILPALEAIAGATFAPKCFYIQEEGAKLMVFNDLKVMGYKMADRKKGMDFEHCKMLIERLAMFHASSMVFVEQNKETMKHFATGMSADPLLVDIVFKSFLARLIETVKEWPEPEFGAIGEDLKKVMVRCSFFIFFKGLIIIFNSSLG